MQVKYLKLNFQQILEIQLLDYYLPLRRQFNFMEIIVMATRKFDAKIGKVLDLMINSIYTNHDIFLRELISNGADACEKLRQLSLNGQHHLNEELKLQISIKDGSDQIEIADNGIGMTDQEMIENLGVIAHSGTESFLENSKNTQNINELIGKFGVGFYSIFMVSQHAEVISKKAGQEKIFCWTSEGRDEYEVKQLESFDFPYESGTIIRLKLKPASVEYAKEYKVRHIVKTYSDHINFPISLQIDDKDPEVINVGGKPLWARPKNEISEDEYSEFYQHIAHMPNKPFHTIHYNVEGNIQYKSILFIPETKPYDLFHPDRQTAVKLYVRKVFITEGNLDIIPKYLRFLRGIVDSEDLPLNISRETLQNNYIVNKISKSIVSKVLKTFKEINAQDPEKYNTLWRNFGEVIKEGLCEGAFEEKQELLEICKFHSSKAQSDQDLITLDDYLQNTLDGQEEIYYLTGNSVKTLKDSPMLEGFNKRGIEVLLLPDQVDEFWVNVVNQYKNKEFKSANAAELDLDKIKPISQDEISESAQDNAGNDALIQFIKDTLKDHVKDVVVSNKLAKSPCVLSIPAGAMNTRMESMLIEQKQLKSRSAKILEINCGHPILQAISGAIETDPGYAASLIEVIFNQACLINGQEIGNPFEFVSKTNSLLERLVS